jgi:ribonuclease Z
VERLAAGADVLLHEATMMNPTSGHSSPYQAGQIAAAAQAKELVLVHFNPSTKHLMAAEAAKSFGGPVAMGHDFMEFEL